MGDSYIHVNLAFNDRLLYFRQGGHSSVFSPSPSPSHSILCYPLPVYTTRLSINGMESLLYGLCSKHVIFSPSWLRHCRFGQYWSFKTWKAPE